jgi:hypothetical protein
MNITVMFHLTHCSIVASIHLLFPKCSGYKGYVISSFACTNYSVLLFSTSMFLNRYECIFAFIVNILTHSVHPPCVVPFCSVYYFTMASITCFGFCVKFPLFKLINCLKFAIREKTGKSFQIL